MAKKRKTADTREAVARAHRRLARDQSPEAIAAWRAAVDADRERRGLPPWPWKHGPVRRQS